jgi:glycosyltransferase involved in cell wall biosynthesis
MEGVRIAFLDPSAMDYTVETPYEQPTGGTQSAVAYLAVELAKLDHAVFLINNTTRRGVYREVNCMSLREGGRGAFLNSMDVVIVVTAAIGYLLRFVENVTTRVLLWVHVSHDQQPVYALLNSNEIDCWDGFVFVSKWQRDNFCRIFSIPAEKAVTLGNAISPAVEAQPIAEPWFETGASPALIYATAPFRGLAPLIDAFAAIRAAVPDVVLRVFSSMRVYQDAAQDDQFAPLFERCRTTPGIEYVGAVDQPRLAVELSRAAALAYPSIFEETSCIVAMEALASGLMVVATSAGALPETTAGFGKLVPWTGELDALVGAYAERMTAALIEARTDPEQAALWRNAQIAFARRTYSWAVRAREWNELVRGTRALG